MLSFRFAQIFAAFLLLVSAVVFLPNDTLADARQWGEDGVYLRQGHHIEWQRASFRNDDGYTLIAWSDTRTGDRDVYGQLIAPDGSQVWESTGKMIARTREFRQEDPEVIAVDGGWIIAWFDFRADTVGDVWAQKINMDGDPMWSANNWTGVQVDAYPSAVNEVTLRAVHDGAGGAILAWEDGRRGDQGDILAQHVDASGNTWSEVLWVTDNEGGQIGITADNDGNGNMLLAWIDGRNDPTAADVYAAKITPDRQLPWGNVQVCVAAGEQSAAKLCPDGSDGCYIAWVDKRAGVEDLYAARLNASGAPLWQADGVAVCTAEYNQNQVRVAASLDGATQDGLIMVWEDFRVNNQIGEIYGQKLNGSGVAQWAANGFKICGDATPEGGWPRQGGRLTSDQAGGMVCAWEDMRNGDHLAASADLYAARILANGTHACGDCGVVVCDSAGAQFAPLVRLDEENGFFVFFYYSFLRSRFILR